MTDRRPPGGAAGRPAKAAAAPRTAAVGKKAAAGNKAVPAQKAAAGKAAPARKAAGAGTAGPARKAGTTRTAAVKKAAAKTPAARKARTTRTPAANEAAAAKRAAPTPAVEPTVAPVAGADEPAPVDDWTWAAWDDEPEDAGGGPTGGPHGPFDDPRVQQGVDGIQRAAREFIEASRALLDVVEDLVENPGSAGGITDLFGDLGTVATRLARNAARGMARATRPPGAGGSDDPGDDGDPPVQRIPVS